MSKRERERESVCVCKFKGNDCVMYVFQVQEALLILIQHGMVGFAQDTHGVLNYKIYVDQVTHRIYFPK